MRNYVKYVPYRLVSPRPALHCGARQSYFWQVHPDELDQCETRPPGDWIQAAQDYLGCARMMRLVSDRCDGVVNDVVGVP